MHRGGVALARIWILGAACACGDAPAPAQLVFQSERTGDGDLYLWSPGTLAVPLIQRPGPDYSPRWDPAGERIVWLADGPDGSELWTIPPDGTEPVLLGPSPGFESPPEWSPDGQALVFAARDGARIGLWVRAAGGGPDRVLLPGPGNDTAPAWAPDGRHIAFVSDRSGETDVWVVNADGTDPRNITVSAGFAEDHPGWSPDGLLIVYDRAPTGTLEADIWVHALAGDSAAAIVTASGPDLVPAWSPDGAWIAFGSSRDGDRDIYRVRPDGTDEERITNSPGFDGNPKWVPGRAGRPPD